MICTIWNDLIDSERKYELLGNDSIHTDATLRLSKNDETVQTTSIIQPVVIMHMASLFYFDWTLYTWKSIQNIVIVDDTREPICFNVKAIL